MGVKRILFSISIGILLLGSVLFLPLSPVIAQGMCSCTINSSKSPSVCEISNTGCTSGYKPQCKTDLSSCNGMIGSCTCISNTATTPSKTPYLTKLCDSIQNDAYAKRTCEECMKNGIWTAIGCIPTTTEGLLNTLLPFFIGIGGGIAFLLILFGALQIMMSAGNPEKLNAGKELISAAITGLLLIIFSIFILQLIGVQILKIPGFS